MIWIKEKIYYEPELAIFAMLATQWYSRVKSKCKKTITNVHGVLPQDLVLRDGLDYTEHLLLYREGTLTITDFPVQYNIPLETQIPYREWLDYSHFIVARVTNGKRKNQITLYHYERYR